MCGIYGFAGKADNPRSVMAALAVLNLSRGDHSTGIFTVREDGRRRVRKARMAADDFIRAKGFNDLTLDPKARVLVGHNRWATHGAVSKANAHPFQIGLTIGVHNGTVDNLGEVREFTGADYPVDSQYLIHMLNVHRHLGPARGKLNVAYHQDKDAADLRIIRHGHPLAMAFDNDAQWFAFSSDYWHLEQALGIVGLTEYECYDLPDAHQFALYLAEDGTVSDWTMDEDQCRKPVEKVKATTARRKRVEDGLFPKLDDRDEEFIRWFENSDDTMTDAEREQYWDRVDAIYNKNAKTQECDEWGDPIDPIKGW